MERHVLTPIHAAPCRPAGFVRTDPFRCRSDIIQGDQTRVFAMIARSSFSKSIRQLYFANIFFNFSIFHSKHFLVGLSSDILDTFAYEQVLESQ